MPRTMQLNLNSREVGVGSSSTIWGSLSGNDGKPVTLKGRLDHGPWQPLATSVLEDGRFQLTYTYAQAGLLQLRLVYPTGDVAEGTVTVR